MRRFKAWLKHNGPVIDFASKIIIAVAALFISFSAYRVAERQSAIAEQQLRLTEISSEPDLYVRHTLIRNPESGIYEHTQVQVHNTGGQAHNVDVNIDSFIRVRRWAPERTVSYVPLVAYYFAHFSMGTPQGLVFQAEGHKSNQRFGELYDVLLTEDFKKKYGFVEAWVVTLVRVDYTTRVGQKRQALFLDGQKIAEKDAVELFKIKKRSDELICFVQIGKLNVEDVLRNEERLRRNERCL